MDLLSSKIVCEVNRVWFQNSGEFHLSIFCSQHKKKIFHDTVNVGSKRLTFLANLICKKFRFIIDKFWVFFSLMRWMIHLMFFKWHDMTLKMLFAVPKFNFSLNILQEYLYCERVQVRQTVSDTLYSHGVCKCLFCTRFLVRYWGPEWPCSHVHSLLHLEPLDLDCGLQLLITVFEVGWDS